MTIITTAFAALWESYSTDLMIFVLTLAFALIIRFSGSKVLRKDVAKAQCGKAVRGNSSRTERVAKSDVPSPKSGRSIVVVGCAGGGGDGAVAGSGDRCGGSERRSGRSTWGRSAEEYRRLDVPSREPCQIIDDVVDGAREQPGLKFAYWALAAHTELRTSGDAESPRGCHCPVAEAARSSRHSALDFYTAIVQCAIRAGKYDTIEGIIDDMAAQGVVRSLVFYESAMKQLAGQKHYHLALSIYDRLAADGLEPSAVTCSCLVSFAAEVGELQRAIGFFEKLSSITTPSIRAYMTVLRVHAKRQDWPASLATLRVMQERGVTVDSLALNIVLATGIAADAVENVEALLAEADDARPPTSDIVSYNTLMKGYAQRNDPAGATRVIDRMSRRNLFPNAITFNTAMDAASRGPSGAEAWNIVKRMREAGLRPDKYTCSILVKGLPKCATPANIKGALGLLHEVDAACDATLRSSLYQSVLETSSHLGDVSLMVQVFTQMRRHGTTATPATHRILAQALSNVGDVKQCGEIWNQMVHADALPQANVFTALLESHLKQGRFDDALKAFRSLHACVKKDIFAECRNTFLRNLCRIPRESEATAVYLEARTEGEVASVDSATASMLARVQLDAGKLLRAWSTIGDILDLGRQPGESILHALLNMCSKGAPQADHNAHAQSLLRKAGNRNVPLTQATYLLLLKVHVRCQKIQDAIDVIEDMSERHGMEAPPQTIVSLLRSCFQRDMPREALELVGRLQARTPSVPLDGTIYANAIGGCARAGLLHEGIVVVDEAVRCGAILPRGALTALSEVAAQWGDSSVAELERLRVLCDRSLTSAR